MDRYDEHANTVLNDSVRALIRILEAIRDTLKNLLSLQEPGIVRPRMRRLFLENMNEAESHLNDAINLLNIKNPPREWLNLLRSAGLTGGMLSLKEESFLALTNEVGQQVTDYSTGTRDQGFIKRFFRKLVPWFSMANILIGSIPAQVFPGKELVKEFKDHLKAGAEDAAIEAID